MELHFLRPYWFIGIIPLLLIIWILHQHLKQHDNWKQMIDAPLLEHLLIFPNSTKNYWPILLLGLMWFISLFALAGPTWEQRPQPLYQNQSAKIILMDLSPSMLAKDINPDRLTRAKYKVLDILKGYREGQTGMAVFTSEAYTVSPLTHDTHTIALMVPELSPEIMPVLGNNIGAGLTEAEKLLQQSHAKSGTILLITDSTPTENDQLIAAKIHTAGYDISVLGVGTVEGAPIPDNANVELQQDPLVLAKLDIPGLEQLADAGGGRFSSFTNTDADIQYLLAPTLQKSAIDKAKLQNNTNLWIDEGRWFILFILPFALLAFRRGGFLELL